MFVCCVCCVASGLCDEPITCSEEFYLVCVCMSNCARCRNVSNEKAKSKNSKPLLQFVEALRYKPEGRGFDF